MLGVPPGEFRLLGGCAVTAAWSTVPPSGRRSGGPERGSALVETAMVLPLVVGLIVLGVLVGLGWRDRVSLDTATAAGARTASLYPSTHPEGLVGAARAATGSQAVLDAVLTGLGSVPESAVDRIVVFTVSGLPTGPPLQSVPHGCRHDGQPGPGERCAILVGGDLNCGRGECPWRDATAGGTGGADDHAGVYLRLDRRSVGPLVGLGPLEAVAFRRFEPGAQHAT